MVSFKERLAMARQEGFNLRLVFEQFWRHVVGSTDTCLCKLCGPFENFGNAKVPQYEPAVPE